MKANTRQSAGVCLVLLMAIGSIHGTEVVVEVTNLSETDGFWLSPTWVAFHDGNFDLFDEGADLERGSPLERLAEDGNPQPLVEHFRREVPHGTTGVADAPGGVADLPAIAPGETGRIHLTVDAMSDRFFSFAAMLMPSNDAFIANEDPQAYEVFAAWGGMYQPFVIHVNGCDVWDAGTEANTQTNAGFFDQTAPDTGITTISPVEHHAGFDRPYPTKDIIMGGTNDLGIYFDPETADFVEGNRPVARIVIIPEPATFILLLGSLALLRMRRRTNATARHATTKPVR